MALIYLKEKPEERTAVRTVDGTNYTRIFQAQTDSVTDDATVLWGGTATGTTLPEIGDEHPNDDKAFVKKIDPKQQNDQLLWLITVSYDTKDAGTVDPDPTNWDPVITYGHVNVSRALDKHYDYDNDLRGEPSQQVRASSLKPFNPPLAQEEQLLLINIRRNVTDAAFDPTGPNTFCNTINSAAIQIAGIPFAKWEGRCRKYGATKKWSAAGDIYWTEDIDIILNPETWIRKVPDISLYVLQGGAPVRARDSRGQPVQAPVLLDGSGAALEPQTDDPVFVSLNAYWEEIWTLMGLPQNA